MYNIAPHPNIWLGMSLDQINQFKAKCQTDMPVVELMKIKADPDSLMGLERDQRLALMGFSWREIEELTGYKRRLHDGSSWVEIEFSAEEQNARAVVLKVAEAAGGRFDALDFRVQPFRDCVGDTMFQIGQ